MGLKRPGKSWTTDSLTIRQLLASIHDRERGLPDFQRAFVWDPDATQELVCSVASTYPAGSLLEIRNSGNLLKPREVEGLALVTMLRTRAGDNGQDHTSDHGEDPRRRHGFEMTSR